MAKLLTTSCVLCLLCVLLTQSSSIRGELEGLDDPSQPANLQAPLIEEAVEHQPSPPHKTAQQRKLVKGIPLRQGNTRDYLYAEMILAVVLILYTVNFWIGKQINHQIATAWAKYFIAPNSIFDKNFSLMGAGDSETGQYQLMRETANVFKFYASGRRYCQGMLVTLNLRARQDLLSRFWNLFSPSDDTVDIEVFMNEVNMPLIVLAVAVPKLARSMHKDLKDITTFTRKIQVPTDALPGWPNSKVHVLTEHTTVFHDLFSDPRVSQIFTSAQYAAALRYFRSIHITSENSRGSHPRVIRFSFAMPPSDDMFILNNLVAIIPILIDLVGTYKVAPDIKKKLDMAREKAAEKATVEDGVRRARLEALQKKKEDKLLAEKQRLARMDPETRKRYEEKQAKKQASKALRMKTVRI